VHNVIELVIILFYSLARNQSNIQVECNHQVVPCLSYATTIPHRKQHSILVKELHYKRCTATLSLHQVLKDGFRERVQDGNTHKRKEFPSAAEKGTEDPEVRLSFM